MISSLSGEIGQPSRSAFNHRAAVLLLACLLFGAARPGWAYSLLTHEEVVDILWKDQIIPLLLKRFPAATPAELRQAHAYAYGGCLIQDLGYYPFGDGFFSDLTHYVRTGDFISNLIQESADPDQYAFALGALAHYSSDNSGHPFVNRAVAQAFPKLRAKYGDTVTYEDSPRAHIQTEFGFDMIQVAKNRYTSDQYHEFIGFKVSQPLLERAFLKTYGLRLKEVLFDVDLAIGTFRRAASQIVPEITRAALTTHHAEEVKETPSSSKRRFIYNLSRAQYEREWGKDYRQPGFSEKAIGVILRLLPKIGPLRSLAFKIPTPAMENLYFKSMNQTVEDYRKRLRQAGEGTLQLSNTDCDTGRASRLGEYALTDATCARLVEELFKRGFVHVQPDVRGSLLAFYDSPPPPRKTRKAQKAWRRTASEVEVLRTGPGSAAEEALRQRLLHPPPGLESPKAKGL
jgi:acyl carrier protein phosphodiesterase